MKESSDKKTVEQGNLYNSIDDPEIAEHEDRKKSLIGIATIAAGVAGAATTVIPKNATADESYGIGVELGPDVNWIQGEGCPTSWLNSSSSAQLMPGYELNRFKLIFSGAYYDNECNAGGAGLAKEFEVDDAPDGGIVIKGLGNALPLGPAFINQPISTLIEVDRGDGRTAKIKQYGNDKIFKDGELKWEKTIIDGGEDFGKWYTDFSAIHQCATAKNHIKLTNAGLFLDPASDDLIGGTFRIDIDSSNYYDAIQQSINDAWLNESKDPYEAGLLKHIEDGKGNAPETDKLLLVGADDKSGVSFVKHDPQTDQYTHLKHNADGTYTPENPQKGEAEFPSPPPWKQNSMYAMALLKVQTPSGKQVHLIATQGEKINWAGGYFDIRLYGVEELTDEKGETYFKDINITLEETDQYPDDDKEGKANHEDNCRWRANPDQVNSTADENGDACKADCKEGGWPGVDLTPLQTNSSGLRVCQSELGYDFAFSFEDGSTIHSNMDVEVSGGKIILKPGQNVRVIHSWDPRTEKLSAPFISLPAGNSVKLKVNSAKNLDGTDGQIVFTHDGAAEYFNGVMDWQDFGIVNNGEIENVSDIEIEVGNENPVTVAETTVEIGGTDAGSIVEETTNVAEPAQTEPALNSAEEAGIAVAEQPNIAEQPSVVEIPVAVEAMPDIYETPDSGAETVEEAGGIVIPPPADVQETSVDTPQQFQDITQDVLQNFDTAKAEPATDAIQNSDTPQGTDTPLDMQPYPDTSYSKDTADAGSKQDLQAETDVEKTDKAIGTDTPVQNKDTHLGTPDVLQGADTAEQLVSKEKSEKSGGGDGCSMAFVLDKGHGNLPYQNFNNIDGLGLLITASVLARLYSWTKRKIAKV